MQKHECLDMSELFSRLTPVARLAEGDGPHWKWLYRGVGDATYDLVPSALRPDMRNTLFDAAGLPAPPDQTWHEQVRAEILVAQRFWRRADEEGLLLPEGGGECRKHLASRDDAVHYIEQPNDPFAVWPPDWLIPLLAMMQHRGLPTRMLDWTRDPFTALYFAASYEFTKLDERIRGRSEAERMHEMAKWEEGDFAVYILDGAKLDSCLGGRPANARRFVKVVAAPGYGNENLRAQRGAFTVICEGHHGASDEGDRPVQRDSFSASVENKFPGLLPQDDPWITKLIGQRRWIDDLMLNLRTWGYDLPRHFPSYDGVARGILGEDIRYST